MFSQELENLIDATLQDGILEEQEKQALIKRALIEGVDIAELDIYINSKLQKRIMEEKVVTTKTKTTEKKQSNRCPHCGSPIPPLSKTCPGCGAAVSVQTTGDSELFELIDSMESAMVRLQTCNRDDFAREKAQAESLIRKAKLFYGDNKKMQMTVYELENKINELSTQYQPMSAVSKTIFYVVMGILAVLTIFCFFSFILAPFGFIFLVIMVLYYLYFRKRSK